MLTFSLIPDTYNNHFQIAIDPELVESVAESSQRPPGYGGNIEVCIITMISGTQHVVVDHGRKVIRLIRDAQEVGTVVG